MDSTLYFPLSTNDFQFLVKFFCKQETDRITLAPHATSSRRFFGSAGVTRLSFHLWYFVSRMRKINVTLIIEKMRLKLFLIPFIVPILFTLTCSGGELPRPISTATPTKMQTVTSTPTRIAILTPFPTNLKAAPIPLWVIDFADPIIAAVANRKPDFQDDFSLNRGWRNVMSGVIRPLYAERYDGMLFLKLPERTKASILYNSNINRRNFVLTLDLRFNHDQPDDTVRFQFDQSSDQSVAFDLSNNRNWKVHWGFQDNWQSMAGIYEHFPPEYIPVTIIMRGTQCAVYLNNDPLTYLNNCRTSPAPQSHGWVASFRLLRDNGNAVAVNFDNFKLWDLDKLPGLP